MKIRLRHLIEFQLYFMLVIKSFISIFGLPEATKYILDINVVLMIALALPSLPRLFKDKDFRKINSYITAYMIAMVAIAVVKNVPAGQIIWAVRNNFFFIIFFFICTIAMNAKDTERILDNIVKLQIYNVICVLLEFFVMHKKNDFLGGMFGTAQGCNVYLNVYMVVITAYTVVRYLYKKTPISTMLMVVISNVAIAAVSELKFYYFELGIILIVSLILSGKSSKNLYIVIFVLGALFIGIRILSVVNAGSIDILSSFDSIVEYGTDDFANEDRFVITRMTSFSQINDYFFNNKIIYKLLGFGFGFSESSKTFAWANSSFADRYEDTGYRHLTVSVNYLETGYIGLILFILIFVMILFKARKFKDKFEEKYNYIVVLSQVFIIVQIANFWYNAGIRIEIAYLSYFMLAMIYIFANDYKQKELENKKHNLNYTGPDIKVKS